MTCNEEILYLRELAKRYASFALSEENVAKKERCRKVNDLIPQRPPVWIDEIPWREMNTDDELTQHCEDSIHRSIEWFLLVNLYRMKHIPVDTVLPDYYPMWKHYSSTGIGVSIDEKVITVNKDSYISSHSFGDCLDTEEKLDLLCAPVITPHPDEDKACTAAAEQVFDGILPVRAVASHASSTPWDMLTRLRGVEPIYVDLYERPDFMHKCVSKLVEIELKRLEQLERYGLLSVEPPTLHCTPPYTNGLPSENYDPCSVRFRDLWFRGTAQAFGSVSPEMFDEFEVSHIKPLAEKFGLTYYGCCEPLHDRIDKLEKINNLRKIGVSPWADVNLSAERIGGKYVYARKPNPALVSGIFNEEAIIKETRSTVEACIKHGCAYEFVLKDISTVGHNPHNLIRWCELVEQTIDEYYK